eukprot:jgi/Picre1/35542/NNA_003003.t1
MATKVPTIRPKDRLAEMRYRRMCQEWHGATRDFLNPLSMMAPFLTEQWYDDSVITIAFLSGRGRYMHVSV